MQHACLCICKGICKVAALILTLFLVPSFTQFFKTKGEGGKEKKKNPNQSDPPPAARNTTVYKSCKL